MPIFDQGYQHWKGELAGHGWRWLAVTKHGVRVGMKNRFLRLLLILSLGPALMLAGVISLWGLVEQNSAWARNFLGGIKNIQELLADPASYRITAWTLCFHFFIIIDMFIVMLAVLMVGPNLISQDLRFNSLPLYFSRPVRRIDYFAGKLGVIAFFLGLVVVVPALIAWVLGLLFSLSFRAVLDTFSLMLGMVVFGVVVSASAGLFMLALSSLSRNSRYIAIMWGGMWFLTWSVSGIMQGIFHDSIQRQSWRLEYEVSRKQSELQQLANQQHQGFMIQPQPDGGGMPKQPKGAQDKKKPQPGMEPFVFKENPAEAEERKKRDARIEQLQQEMLKDMDEIKKQRQAMEESLREDWRPIISYTANLQRIGFALIGSQDAWDKVDELVGNRQQQQQPGNPAMDMAPRRQRIATMMVPQYPWYWSALVLLALGGLSLWILHKRVTSLDRLK